MAHTLAQFNDAAPQDAAAMLADLYPHAPWAAQQAVRARPMHSVAQLQLALQRAVDDADVATQLALLRAQPALDAGADAAARIADHAARFGFPFVLSRYSPRGAGLQDAQRVQALERRQHNAPDDERREACLLYTSDSISEDIIASPLRVLHSITMQENLPRHGLPV